MDITRSSEHISMDDVVPTIVSNLEHCIEIVKTDPPVFMAVVMATPCADGMVFQSILMGNHQLVIHALNYIADVAAPEAFAEFLALRAQRIIKCSVPTSTEIH